MTIVSPLLMLGEGGLAHIPDKRAARVAWQPLNCGEAAQRALPPGTPDPEFAKKMAKVLCVYREVKLLRKRTKSAAAVAIVSYGEKPGVQPIGVTAPDLPPVPGIDVLTGKVHALVKDCHRSREFIEFLKLLDVAYPTHTATKMILDNHSAHISQETHGWLALSDQGASRSSDRRTVRGSISSKASSPSSPARCCATSVLHPSRNSRIASWPQSTSSIISLSSTLGPTCWVAQPEQPDMIRSKETMQMMTVSESW